MNAHRWNLEVSLPQCKMSYLQQISFLLSDFFSPIMGLNEMLEKIWHKVGFKQQIGFFNGTHCTRVRVKVTSQKSPKI